MIIKTEGICGGDARVDGTRIPVWMLEILRQAGCSEIQILNEYPHLNLNELREAFSYADNNSKEIQNLINLINYTYE
ncbi:DUF433 domain-containing protein [Candidatus Parcubacteria bacterium]|nr:MAG: DUF433 domain-containing protein [Candidatus Parcubacteria bacterium]